MNVWWEKFFQLGLPLFSTISLVIISYLLIRKEKNKKQFINIIS